MFVTNDEGKRENVILGRYLEQISRGKTEATLNTYRRRIGLFVDYIEDKTGREFDAETLRLVNGSMVQDFYIHLQTGRSVATINHYLTILRPFCRNLKHLGLITGDQLEDMLGILEGIRVRNTRDDSVSAENGGFEAFTPEQIYALIHAPRGYQRERNRAIIAMLLGSGLRAIELCSLTVGSYRHMDDDNRILCRRKGGEKRWVQISAFAKENVDAYLDSRSIGSESEPLFITKYNTPMSPNNLWDVLNTMLKSVGLPSGTHNFRRTFLTGAEQLGGAAVARDLANHKSIVVTNRYLRPASESKKEVVNSLPWAGIFSKENFSG